MTIVQLQYQTFKGGKLQAVVDDMSYSLQSPRADAGYWTEQLLNDGIRGLPFLNLTAVSRSLKLIEWTSTMAKPLATQGHTDSSCGLLNVRG
jgi:hypothetical protein